MTPQHFQQQERFLTHQSSQYYGLLNPCQYGFTTLEIDKMMLTSGQFGLTGATGIFPDLTPFSIDETLVLAVPENTANAVVYLSIPIKRHGSAEVGEGQESEARYRFHAEEIQDSIRPEAPSTRIDMARPNIKLQISTEKPAGYSLLPLALIEHIDSNGVIHLDKSFIPPALNLKVSEYAMDRLQELAGRIRQKNRALSSRVIAGKRFKSEQSLWQDQIWTLLLSQWQAKLGVIIAQPMLSPIALYQELMVMVGCLSTLLNREAPEPQSLHPEQLTSILPILFDFLLDALSLASKESVVELLLDQSLFLEKRILTTRLPGHTTRKHRCILAVVAHDDNSWLVDSIPRFCTLAPERDIQALLTSAMPGLELKPLSLTPAELNLPDCQTFEIDTDSTAWQQIQTENDQLVIHIDRQIGEPEIRLFLIQQV